MDRAVVLATGRDRILRNPNLQKHHVLVGVIAAIAAVGVCANPNGGDVSAGSATINQSGSAVTIDQTSARVAINWQSFNIGAGESVTFNQPSTQSIALNRILGQDPSLIQGSLTTNGQVFLLNPNGVLFGAGAQVDVGGIVASTLDLSNDDFLAGRYTFTAAGGNTGSVLNEGTIRTADGGYVAFAGSNVTNAGVIRAHLGTVALGAGDQVTMNIDGGRLVGFNVDKAAVAALASNRQLIETDGGTVILSARAKDALLATVVNNDGVIEARSVKAHNGVVELDGGVNGVVAVSGTLDASGVNSGESGGRVDVTGDKVALLDGAAIDVSGSAGGGTVRVGGDYQGANPDFQNAARTFVASSARIDADALETGDGGRITVWADGDTQFHGSIGAHGGNNGGDGGFVEVSGKQHLGFDGSVDTSAVRGAIGTLLLDPDDLFIASAAVGGALPDATNPFQAVDGVNNYYVLGTTLTALPVNTNVALQANHNIVFQTNLAMSTTPAGSMTLNATNAIQMAGFDLSTGGSDVSMTAGAGGITNLGSIDLGNGAGNRFLTLNASGSITQNAGDVISGGTSLVKQGAGTLTLSSANTYAGTTTVSGGTLAVTVNNALGTNAAGTSVNAGATLDLRNVVYGTTEAVTLNGGTLATSTGTSSLAGGVTLAANSAVNVSGTQLTLSGVVGGAGAMAKSGAGILTLSGTNTYGGLTTISGGTLRAASSSALGGAGTGTTVANGGRLQIANVAVGAEAVTLNGTGGGGGALVGTGTASLGGAVTLASASTIAASSAGDLLTLGGTINGAAALTQTGTGTVSFGNTVGATTALTSFTSNAGSTTRVNGGSLRTTGTQLYNGALTTGGATTLRTTNSAITANGAVNATAGPLTLVAGTGNATFTNASNNFGTVGVTNAGAVNLVDMNGLNLAASSVSTLQAQTLAGDITISGIIGATGAGDSIVLASGGNFVNTIGSAALNPGAGRWLVWSTNPSLDTRGGLANVFKQYNATYGVTPVASGGNGFLYTLAPTVSVGLIGAWSQVYDGSTSALLAPSNYNVSGAVDGDTVAINNPGGTFDNRNVGTNKNIAVSGLAITSATNLGTTVYGYQLANTSANANIGTITPAGLTVTATTNTKAYDTTTSAAAAPIATGLVGGDTATGLTEAYADKNAGTGKTMLVSGYTVNDGNGGNNYTVSLVNNTTGVINQATLTGNVAAANKTYDGTNAATINSRTLAGVVGGDAVSYVGGTATFADKNAALGKVVTATGLGLAGVDANNYTVNTTATTTADIGMLAITGAITAANKTYDGTDDATITDRTLSGVIGGDTVAYVGGTANFSDKNAGVSKTVTATGLDLAGVDAGNYTVNDTATTTADIAALAITGAITAANKTYDGTNDATIVDRTLTGVIGGDAVSYVGGIATFSDKNAALGKTVTATGLGLAGVDATNYTVNTTATTTADITALGITGAITAANKTYDGTTAATITDRTLSGVIGGDTVSYVGGTANFADKNTGLGKTVTATGLGLTGVDAGNYTVNSTATTTADIAALAITGAITAANKTYDGTNDAAITDRTLSGVIVGDTVSYVGGIATFSDENAALGKTVTATGLGLAGADATNYTVNTTATTTADIAALGITGAITAANKTYDGTTAATITDRTLAGVIAGDTVAYVGGTATFADKNTGLGKTVTGTGLSLAGVDANNYTVNTTATTTADIAALAIIGEITAANKMYDGTTAATITDRTLTGVVSGDTVSYVGGIATFADKNAGLGKTVTATGLGLAGVDANNYTVNTSAIATADIATLAITGAITAANKAYDGTTAATITDRTLSGVIGGDSVSYVGSTAAFADKNTGLGKTVTATGLGLAGVDANNYTVNTTAITSADIAALAITGAITAANKTYDGTTAATITDRTLSGVIGSDTVTYVGGTADFSDKNAALGKTVTATGLGLSGADASNYTVNTTATTTADIATLAIAGAITAANKAYDGTTSATIADRTLTGVISGDTVAYVGGTASFSDKNVGLSKSVAATGLGLAGLDAGNYSVNTTATTNADIAALAITGAITAANKTYDGTADATIVNRTLTGVIGGDIVSYVGGIATFSDKNAALGKTVAATGLSLSGVDANNYTVNTTATTSADITALGITGAITAANKTYDATTAATITDRTLTGVISGDAVSYVGGVATFVNKNAGLGKIVTATGLGLAGADANNYSVNGTATTTADIAALGIAGAITAANKVYDGDTTATITNRALTGVISGDTVSYVGGTATFADKNAGLAKTVTGAGLALSGADAGNYTVNTTAMTAADITQRPITVTADIGQTKVYGNADPLPFTYAITSGNLVTGDSLSGALSRHAGENAGSYAITQNTLTAGSNYNLAFLANPFAITPATLTYAATATDIFQGAPFPPFTGTVQGFMGSDTMASATTGALAFTTTAPNSDAAGTFPIDGSGLSANSGNYVFVQHPANPTALVIAPADDPPPFPGGTGEAFFGALASAGQSEAACAELRDEDTQQTLCGVQLNYRQTERVNLVPGFRRIIESPGHTFRVEDDGIRLPVGVGQ